MEKREAGMNVKEEALKRKTAVAGEKYLAAEPRFDGGDDLLKREFRVVILLGAKISFFADVSAKSCIVRLFC